MNTYLCIMYILMHSRLLQSQNIYIVFRGSKFVLQHNK